MQPHRRMVLNVVGIKHAGRAAVVRRHAADGGVVWLRREPQNAHDSNAIAVWMRCSGTLGLHARWCHIGYVPASTAKVLAPLMDIGRVTPESTSIFDVRPGFQEVPPKVELVMLYRGPDSEAGTLEPQRGYRDIELDDPQWLALEAISNGDRVKLWLHPTRDEVRVYAQGSLGGQGLLGVTENRALIRRLSGGLPVEAVALRSGGEAWVRCRFRRAAAS